MAVPRTSARSWRQNGLRANPPVARSSVSSSPAARIASSTRRELQAHALQGRPGQVGAAVPLGQPQQRPVRVAAPPRGALTGQVRQHQQALGARGHRRRQLRQLLVRVGQVGADHPAEPAQHVPAVVRGPADDPAARDEHVAEHPPCSSTRGSATTPRIAPLVPIEQATTPGATAPTPRFASTPSLAPATPACRRAAPTPRQHPGRGG